MRARFTYLIAFFLPSAFVAGAAGFFSAGMLAGVLWLFVYGDNPWPDSTGVVIVATMSIIMVLVFLTLLVASYSYGKQREPKGGLCNQHLVLAVALTVVFPLLLVLRQCSVGG